MGENGIDFRHLRIYLGYLFFDDAGRHFLSRHGPLVETLIPDSAKSKFAACHSPASTLSVGRNMRETGGGGFSHSSFSQLSAVSTGSQRGTVLCGDDSHTETKEEASTSNKNKMEQNACCGMGC